MSRKKADPVVETPPEGVLLPTGLKTALEAYLASRPCGEWASVDDQGVRVEAWRLLTAVRGLV